MPTTPALSGNWAAPGGQRHASRWASRRLLLIVAGSLLSAGCMSSRSVDNIRSELRTDLAEGRLEEARTDLNALHDSTFVGEHSEWEAEPGSEIELADELDFDEEQRLAVVR